MTTSVNEHGVDITCLAREIELWLTRRPDRTATQLADFAGINPRGVWELRRGPRPRCSLDWADRLAIAMDIPLNDIAPWPPPDAAQGHPARPSTRRQRPTARTHQTTPRPRPPSLIRSAKCLATLRTPNQTAT